MVTRRLWTTLLAALAAVPIALASPLDPAFKLIANVASVEALQNQDVLIGFYRFAFFVIIFATFYWSGRKFVFARGGEHEVNKKTAVIVALVLGIIGAFAMPSKYVLASGNVWMVTINTLIMLTPSIALLIFAMKVFKGEWWQELIGLGFVGLAWWLFNIIKENFTPFLTEHLPAADPYMKGFLDWAQLLFLIFVIVKIIRATGNQGEGGLMNWGRSVTPSWLNPRNWFGRRAPRGDGERPPRPPRRGERRGPPPGIPGDTQHQWDGELPGYRISWNPPPGGTPVAYYEVQRREEPRLAHLFKPRHNLIGGWQTVGRTGSNTYADRLDHRHQMLLNPRNLTYPYNRRIHPNIAYQYRVRAVSPTGVRGYPALSTPVGLQQLARGEWPEGEEPQPITLTIRFDEDGTPEIIG